MLSFIKEDYIFLKQNIKSKEQLFRFIAEKAYEKDICKNQESLIESLNQREEESSTLISDDIGLPHARVAKIKKLSVFIITLEESIIHNQEGSASIFFCILAPLEANNEFIDVLMNIAEVATNNEFISSLYKNTISSSEVFINIKTIVLGGK